MYLRDFGFTRILGNAHECLAKYFYKLYKIVKCQIGERRNRWSNYDRKIGKLNLIIIGVSLRVVDTAASIFLFRQFFIIGNFSCNNTSVERAEGTTFSRHCHVAFPVLSTTKKPCQLMHKHTHIPIEKQSPSVCFQTINPIEIHSASSSTNFCDKKWNMCTFDIYIFQLVQLIICSLCYLSSIFILSLRFRIYSDPCY